LEELVLKLGECGIKPYYLHHPDLARGTAHFRLSFEEGMALVQALRQRVSGYLVPDYVLDSPHGHIKTSINPWSVQSLGRAGHYRITEPTGQSYAYYDPALDPEASTNSSHGITSSQPLAEK
jgi:lysine 2,3-aminomutase